VQLLFSITQNQTNSPIHAFLVAAMDIFPPQACKKLTANENNKTKNWNPKTFCVHIIRMTYCLVTLGCCKNLEKLVVFISSWVIFWFSIFFENHDYIPQPVIWKFWELAGQWIYTLVDNWWVSIPNFKNHPNNDLDPWLKFQKSKNLHSRVSSLPLLSWNVSIFWKFSKLWNWRCFDFEI
jgi:hypothetical protein